jgi:outer membrane protein assembly factor BamB
MKWIFKHIHPLSVPVAAKDRIVFASDDSFIYCLSLEDGREFWKFKTTGTVTAFPVIKEGYVYVISDYMDIYAIDMENGKELWGIHTEKPVHNMIVIIN